MGVTPAIAAINYLQYYYLVFENIFLSNLNPVKRNTSLERNCGNIPCYGNKSVAEGRARWGLSDSSEGSSENQSATTKAFFFSGVSDAFSLFGGIPRTDA